MTSLRTFLGIGAQKAGTTRLAGYLAHHPHVYIPPIKEMHFFDLLGNDRGLRNRAILDIRLRHRFLEAAVSDEKDITPEMNEIRSITERFAIGHDPDKYRAMLMDAPAGKTICGEFTPAYAAMTADQIARIPQVLDRPRILFILRNPVDRFLSQVSHHATPLTLNPEEVDSPLNLLDKPGFTERTRYDWTLKSLDAVFPAEDVYVGFFEDLYGPDARDFHHRICTFLGLDPALGQRVPHGKPAKTRDCAPQERKALVEAFEPAYRDVKERLGRLPATWEADLATL